MTTYKILDELPAESALPATPTHFWLLITLEVVVSDPTGNYLLLTYPAYAHRLPLPLKTSDAFEGFWAPPFLAHHVPTSYASPQKVGSVKKLFEDFEKTINVETDIKRLAYLEGLSDPKIAEQKSFIELKRSPRNPEQIKCYKILRFGVEGIGQQDYIDLSDPECLRGYVYLPLDEGRETIRARFSTVHDCEYLWYLSKPLMTNLRYVIGTPDRREGLCARAIKLEV
ncbi:MAG: hypothetical protein ACRD8U_01780 [Pyrinomonadaceae bacterium]